MLYWDYRLDEDRKNVVYLTIGRQKRVMEKSNTLMTSGSIWKQILRFSIPLILGNLFQQMYSIVDSIIVGNVVGSDALAAVGASGSIIQLLIGFIIGASAGAGVVTSQYYGAQNEEGVRKAVHTTFAIAIVCGVIISVVGVASTNWILEMMDTPEEVFDDAAAYLRWFFAGHFFAVIYNLLAGILNAVGNSKRALIFLVIATVCNIVLDILFVAVFKWGVVGAAIATDLSQAVSCVCILVYMYHSKQPYRIRFKDIGFHDNLLKRIIVLGLPTGVQNIIISLSNVILQASVNSFGATVMASYAAFNRIDGFILLPVLSIGTAATTFAGQNYGAKKIERILDGLKISVGMGTIYSIVAAAVMLVAGPYIIQIFTTEQAVIDAGVKMMWYMYPFYWLLAMFHIALGSVRGVGKTMESMMISVFSLCVCRVIWIFTAVKMWHHLFTLSMAYSVTWLIGAVIVLIYLKKRNWIEIEERKVNGGM